MALDNTLNVEVTATVDGLKKNLDKAKKSVTGFEKSTESVSKTTDKLGKSVGANAVPALTSFSQVVQDAPYGIRGVANNITQLTSQFGYLSKSSGGAKAALKAMLGTLSGPAGVLLVVSLVTSALVAFGDKMSFAKDKASKLKDEQDKLSKSLTDYKESLTGVRKAQLDGSQSAADELTRLSLLKTQLDNTNLSQSKRLKAYKELLKKYPDYLGNVSEEDALVGGLDGKYNLLTEAILKNAKAQAAAKLISQNYQKILNLQFQLQDNAIQINEDTAKSEEIKAKKSERALNAISGAYGGVVNTQEGLLLATSNVNQGFKKQAEIVSEINKLYSDNEKLVKSISDLGGILQDNGKGREIGKPMLAFFESYKSQVTGMVPIANQLRASMINSIPVIEMTSKIAQMKMLLEQLNQGAKDIIQNGIANTFSQIGDAIGNAMSTGANVLEATAGAIMQGLSGLLGAMGDYLIKAGTAAVLAGTVTKLFGSAMGIGAGLAAIAGGTALKALSKSISNFGGAGVTASDYSSDGGSRSYGSSVSYGSSGVGGGKVVFEIAGTKLIGVLSNTINENTSLGGALTVN